MTFTTPNNSWLCHCKHTWKLLYWPHIPFCYDMVWTDMNKLMNFKNWNTDSKAYITSLVALIKCGTTRTDFYVTNVAKLSVQISDE
jgi:hypothetical protein